MFCQCQVISVEHIRCASSAEVAMDDVNQCLLSASDSDAAPCCLYLWFANPNCITVPGCWLSTLLGFSLRWLGRLELVARL